MKTYHSLVIQGNMQTKVRWITERDTGGVLHPEEQCTKTVESMMEVLRTKQSDARLPPTAILETYPDRLPELISVDITNNTVIELAE